MLHLNSIDLKCIKGGSNVTIAPIAALGTAWIVTLVILAILIIALVIVGVWGNKQQKKSADAQQQLQDAAQPMTLLVIDKKRMKISEANLPKVVIDNVPKMMRRSKLPIVKAKVGPQIVTLVCDQKIFDLVPVKKEVKATVSGLYITGVRGLRGPLEKPVKKKKGFRAKLQEKYNEANAQLKESKSGSSRKKK